jgi:hypothetical protein
MNNPLELNLRDYFAARASDADISLFRDAHRKEEFVVDTGYGRKRIETRDKMFTREQARYLFADAMIKTRNE